MKYYIPTSSLNLDNILQAESISPFSFYAQRKTGYKSIELIDEVKQFSNHVVLFDYPVSFSIVDPGRYNFPLLIEVDDDIQLHDIEKMSEGMCLCNHTIYLNPKNTSFYFYSEGDYKLTLINTKDNKSIKYYKLYKIHQSVSSLETKAIKIELCTGKLDVGENNEITIDKQKGVLFAHLLGQLMSVTPQLSRQLFLSQKLYDVLTSIISLPRKKDFLMINLSGLLEEYKSIDPIEQKNRVVFEEKLKATSNEYGNNGFFEQVIQLGVNIWNNIKLLYCKKWNCTFLPDITTLETSKDFSILRDEVENHTEKAIEEYRKSQAKPSIATISIIDGKITIENKPIINTLISYIVEKQIIAEQLFSDRSRTCLDLINEIKCEIQNKKGEEYWKSSSERDYLKRLYQHIRNISVPFSLKEIEDVELIAVAAFLLRGEDIDSLLTYLKMNEVTDYCEVLALWGVLCGYIEMNRKVFPDEILTEENYRNVYQCLFGTMKEMGKAMQTDTLSINNTILKDYWAVLKLLELKGKVFNLLRDALNSDKFIDMEKTINEVLESDPCHSFSKQCRLARKAYKLVLAKNKYELFCSLLNDPDFKFKHRQGVAAYFNVQYKPNKRSSKRNNENIKEGMINFNETEQFGKGCSAKCITSAPHVSAKIELVVDRYFPQLREPVKDKRPIDFIKEDWVWVSGPGCSVNLSLEMLIKRFHKKLVDGKTKPNSSKGKDMKWKNDLYVNLDIDKFIKRLREHLEDK